MKDNRTGLVYAVNANGTKLGFSTNDKDRDHNINTINLTRGSGVKLEHGQGVKLIDDTFSIPGAPKLPEYSQSLVESNKEMWKSVVDNDMHLKQTLG